jgi:hypothetical protein
VAEEADQLFAFTQLLFCKPQRRARAFQREGSPMTAAHTMEQRQDAGFRYSPWADPATGQAHPLKIGVERPLVTPSSVSAARISGGGASP